MIKGYQDLVTAFQLARSSAPPIHVLSVSLAWYDADVPGATLSTLDPYYKSLASEVAFTVQSGIVVCCAAGNQATGPGPGLERAFPASHPDVFAVGGVHANYTPNLPGGFSFEASNYASSFDSALYPGRHVPDVCGLVGKDVNHNAPLIMLPTQANSWVDTDGGNTGATDDGWTIGSGTSCATPQVAGVAALVKDAVPTLKPSDVRHILANTAQDVTVGQSAMGHLAGPGPDAATGGVSWTPMEQSRRSFHRNVHCGQCRRRRHADAPTARTGVTIKSVHAARPPSPGVAPAALARMVQGGQVLRRIRSSTEAWQLRLSPYRLADCEEVSFTVAKPRGALAACSGGRIVPVDRCDALQRAKSR
jgi:Subtilase family